MHTPKLKILVAESEPAAARHKRRASVGRSSGETYEAVLAHVAPQGSVDRIRPADPGSRLPPRAALIDYDAVFLTGSPLHLYEESAESRRVIAFMRAVFDAGTPAFGSCAGLQVATVAAGGTVRPMGARREAGFARRICPTEAGSAHPLLRGRPRAFDAPAVHTDEVATLPERGVNLASNGVTAVQAAEICCGAGTFWGVQYHPEISLFEVAAALRRQAGDLIEHALARHPDDVERHAALIEALDAEPERQDLAWMLGLDEQVTRASLRTAELRNFVEHLVLPTRSRRLRD